MLSHVYWCKLQKNKPQKTELEKLPPITKAGANTFGCLINGKAWIPKDNNGQASFQLYADPTFQDGVIGITAIKYPDIGQFQSISFGSDSCKEIGIYLFNESRNNAQFANYQTGLILSNRTNGDISTGNLNITKYDLHNRIFSGTFEYTIYNNNGDTVRITNGRFDKKL